MSLVSKLQYGQRFGEEVTKIVREALPPSSSQSEEEVAIARYGRWFYGPDYQPEPLTTSSRKFRRLSPDMAAAEVAAITRDNLSILGDDANALFSSKLPTGHRMRKAIRSSILPDAPYLGTCRFGEVVTDCNGDTCGVTQLFIANFDGDLDLASAKFYKPKSRDFDQMFFGVHVIVDRFGNPLGFNLDRGRKGVAFKTKDMVEALYSVASASTGLSRQALRARAEAARRKT